MVNTTSFLIVIKGSIKTKAFTKDYYEEVIATWALRGWLTEEEVVEALAYLEEVFAE